MFDPAQEMIALQPLGDGLEALMAKLSPGTPAYYAAFSAHSAFLRARRVIVSDAIWRPIGPASSTVRFGAKRSAAMSGAIVAAWVQAAGSIAAIWVAARLLVYEQRSRTAQRLEALYGLGTVAAEVVDAAASVSRAAGQGAAAMLAEFPLRRFDYAEAALTAVPLHELRSPMLLALIVDLHQVVSEARHEVEQTINGGPNACDSALLSRYLKDSATEAAVLTDELRVLAAAAQGHNRRWWLW